MEENIKIEKKTKAKKAVKAELKVKDKLSFRERVAAVKDIARMVIVDNNADLSDTKINYGRAEYIPSAFEFAKRYAFVQYYTNIKLPEDIDDAWDFLMEGTAYTANVGAAKDFESVVEEAQDLIDFEQSCISCSCVATTFMHELYSFVETIKAQFAGIDVKKIVNVVSKMDNFDGEKITNALVAKTAMQASEKIATTRKRTKK